MNAKDFILNNSKAFSKAVDQGYDIRMDENEILDSMEKYAQYKAENLPISDVSISSGLHDRNGKELKLGDQFKYFKHEGYLLDDFTAEVVFENGAFCYKVIKSNVNSYPTAFCEHDELKQDFLNWIEILH